MTSPPQSMSNIILLLLLTVGDFIRLIVDSFIGGILLSIVSYGIGFAIMGMQSQWRCCIAGSSLWLLICEVDLSTLVSPGN